MKPLRIALKVCGVLFGLAALSVLGLWLQFRPDAKGRVIPLFERIDMAAHHPFTAGVKASSTVRLFEGLPHQNWERELLESELDTKQTFESHGFHFYQAEITPTAADAAVITTLAASSDAFEEWGGMKLCGGYHPDWLIRWTSTDGQTHELHLCFGCHEAKLYGSAYQLYCDVADAQYETLKATLSRYAYQRPMKAEQNGAANPAKPGG